MACGCEGVKCRLEPGDNRHGTPNGYTNRGCRCDACREARREHCEANREAITKRQKAYYEAHREARLEYQNTYRAEQKAAGLPLGDERHGTVNGYTNYGCRCDSCRQAQRECRKAYREAHSEAERERSKAHYEANREAILARARALREADREAHRERDRAYYEANREALREYSKAYQKANPDMYRARHARRRARKKGAFIGPAFTRQQVWDRDSGICHICNLPADPDSWHMDHVIPLVRGGAHSFENCAVSCPTCNLRKGARLLDELAAGCTMSTVSH